MAPIAKIAVVTLILSGVPCPRAQSPAPHPATRYNPHMTFDVATIHESRGGTQSYIDNAPKSSFYQTGRATAWGLILRAYDIRIGDLIKNLPDWGTSLRLDVTAKSDDATDVALAQLSESEFRSEKRHMLQQLLADRFKLQIHPETRISTTYELTATDRTPRLMTLVSGDAGKTISSCNLRFSSKGMEVEAKGCPFYILFGQLQDDCGTPIVDRTGLEGAFAYHLMWSDPVASEKDGVERFPLLADALRQQLGLEMKRTQGPVTFWVVDHIERPTPN